ncbi:hypothetical protein RchiOBHm_Chr5g0033211 [Rosa chinensis]|uniref:VQ domain-containing protein n=1 Tax=Rosa chinensis TaxID=74649 RepID=A0A2P6QAM5_ROSCH|nr:VQ motif-containing protein 4 [Rosa chinensis]PRQ31232.1 hypothetical protein RchiOBHm_Chr5g0033211 [Rosa chinensis]
MEYTSRPQEQTRDHHHHHHQKPPASYSPLNSPTSNGSSNNNNNSGVPTPTTPKLTPRSDSNPYATTFVQADSSNFKHVVQMLTGSSETTTKQTNKHTQESSSSPLSSKNFTIPPVKTAPKKQQGFKLYERRSQNLKNSLMINTLMPNFAHHRSQASSGFSPRHPAEILSPSLLDFPSLTLSPVTPLNDDHFDKSASSPLGNSSSEEDRAIAEKGFYLHPSPRTSTSTPREPEPRLLPLFPVTSPRVSGSSS